MALRAWTENAIDPAHWKSPLASHLTHPYLLSAQHRDWDRTEVLNKSGPKGNEWHAPELTPGWWERGCTVTGGPDGGGFFALFEAGILSLWFVYVQACLLPPPSSQWDGDIRDHLLTYWSSLIPVSSLSPRFCTGSDMHVCIERDF